MLINKDKVVELKELNETLTRCEAAINVINRTKKDTKIRIYTTIQTPAIFFTDPPSECPIDDTTFCVEDVIKVYELKKERTIREIVALGNEILASAEKPLSNDEEEEKQPTVDFKSYADEITREMQDGITEIMLDIIGECKCNTHTTKVINTFARRTESLLKNILSALTQV